MNRVKNAGAWAVRTSALIMLTVSLSLTGCVENQGQGRSQENGPPDHAGGPRSETSQERIAGQGLASCLMEQDPAICQASLEGLPEALSQCPPEEAGLNCAFNAAYDFIGAEAAAGFFSELAQQCGDTPGRALCSALRDSAGLPDRVPLTSEPVARGRLIVESERQVAPREKRFNDGLLQWDGEASRIGGTAHYHSGEHIYSDYVMDAFGADDGDDARRLAVMMLLGETNSRTIRLDQLFQAAGDQFGAPRPAGAPDHYGDATDREDGSDLTEVRWAADKGKLHLLTRVGRLMDERNLVVLVLADTRDDQGGLDGLDIGLDTRLVSDRFDRAALLRSSDSRVFDTRSGQPMGQARVHLEASGYDNFLQASLPRHLLEHEDGRLRVAVMTLRENRDGSLTPANIAYRFHEPVAGLYNERSQGLSLFQGNIDQFVADIDLDSLTSGLTQTVRPGPGYHERRFASGDNISVEDSREQGRHQHYGFYVPSDYDPENASPLTFWLHYRGGKAHSGAAWTPRLIHQLGEEVNNIVVTPRARGTSSWYVSSAHQDMFEVFADAAGLDITRATALPSPEQYPGGRHPGADGGLFNVDASRVYLSGYSMGGYGTYQFGLLYPDLFAAGFSSSGSTTQGGWTGLGPQSDVCGDGTACFIEANGGRANAQLNWRLLENARHFPLAIHHGTNDQLVPYPGVARFAKRLTELGYRHDLLSFFGYEHFTQAIVDEWADGAFYLQKFQRPVNPREVTYKRVPALIGAVQEVRRGDSIAEPDFSFIDPRGAYWVDDLTMRDGDPGDPDQFALVEAESKRLPGNEVLTAPRSGLMEAPDYVTSPVFSPANHSTPFARTGVNWLVVSEKDTTSNAFEARLENVALVTLQSQAMALDNGQTIEGLLQSDGLSKVQVTGLGPALTICGALDWGRSDGRDWFVVGEGESRVSLLAEDNASCEP